MTAPIIAGLAGSSRFNRRLVADARQAILGGHDWFRGLTFVAFVEMAEEPHVISFSEAAKLDQGQVSDLVRSIRKMPGKSLSLSVAEYRALTNFQKGLWLHKGGRIQKISMTRAAFDQLTPGRQMKFIKEGGKLR